VQVRPRCSRHGLGLGYSRQAGPVRPVYNNADRLMDD
jgi:hypothetical protein